MKILIDCRFWGPKHTGLGRYTENLIKNLLAVDKKNKYVLLIRKNSLISQAEFSKPNVKFKIIDIEHYSLKEQLLLPFIIRKIKPDLVHFPHFNVPFFLPFPYIVTIHDLIKHYSRGWETTTRHPLTYLLKYFAYKQVFKQAIKKAKKIIVPSQVVKKQLLKEYNLREDKIAVIYEGVENKFSISKLQFRNSEKVLKKYKIKKPYLLYVGNAYPHKNLRRLILAVKLVNQSLVVSLSRNVPEIQLVIVSARNVFWQRLKKTVTEFKASSFISLPGFISESDLPIFYQQAEGFVFPSLMEGFGLTGLEAMKAGCPVVCSQIPIFKEIYGKAVIYFAPEKIGEMKEKIMALLTFNKKKREELIKKGEKQSQKYSWKKCSQKTKGIYQRIGN